MSPHQEDLISRLEHPEYALAYLEEALKDDAIEVRLQALQNVLEAQKKEYFELTLYLTVAEKELLLILANQQQLPIKEAIFDRIINGPKTTLTS